MWAILALGSWMMVSGYILHRETEGEWLPVGVDSLFFRHWHNTLSTLFIAVFGLQMLTGFALWFVPQMIRRTRPVRSQETL